MKVKDALHVLFHGLPHAAPSTIEEIQVEVVKHTPDYDVTRHHLGSVNLKDIRDMKVWDESEKREHAGEIATIHSKKSFKLEIDTLLDAQAYFCAENAEDNRQLDFARGTMNGIMLVWERIAQIATEHYERTKPPEEFDPHGFMDESPIAKFLESKI